MSNKIGTHALLGDDDLLDELHEVYQDGADQVAFVLYEGTWYCRVEVGNCSAFVQGVAVPDVVRDLHAATVREWGGDA